MNKRCLFIVAMLLAGGCSGQKDSIASPPFLRFPSVPVLRLLLTDSATLFTKDQLKKNKPVLIVLFSPDCEHCQNETQEMISNIDLFNNIQVVMATNLPFDKMKLFYEKYELGSMTNWVVGQDIYSILPSFYHIRHLPFHAMYDKRHRLISFFEGSMEVSTILDAFEKKIR